MRKYKTNDGIEITLTQDAYGVNYGTDGEVRYYAHATDKDGNEYMVTWACIDKDTEDESNACDWDNPIDIRKI